MEVLPVLAETVSVAMTLMNVPTNHLADRTRNVSIRTGLLSAKAILVSF